MAQQDFSQTRTSVLLARIQSEVGLRPNKRATHPLSWSERLKRYQVDSLRNRFFAPTHPPTPEMPGDPFPGMGIGLARGLTRRNLPSGIDILELGDSAWARLPKSHTA